MGINSAISDQLVFFVNGKKIVVNNPDPEWTLAYFLRNKLYQYGTKIACGTGGCGACTVMLSRIDHDGKIINLAVNACLVPLSAVHGTAIVTVEGIGNANNLHPIQERMAKSHSTQCGFCSPGFVMSTYALLRNNPSPSEKELEDAIQGNLCRCTGYRPILESLKTFCGSPNCCKNKGNNQQDAEEKNVKEIPYSLLYDESSFKPYDPSQDPIFPPELKLASEKLRAQSLQFKSEFITLFRPSSLQELLELKKSHPESTIIAGGTGPGLRQNINTSTKTTLIQISPSVKELYKIEDTSENLIVGAAVTFAQLDEFCKRQPEAQALGNIFSTFSKWVTLVGDVQLRNVGTVGGAIVCENPASDFASFLIGLGASVTLSSSAGGDESVIISAERIRKTGGILIKPHQVLTSMKLPKTQKDEIIWSVKRSNRKYGDTAIVNATAKITFDSTNGDSIRTLNFAFGGKVFKNVLQVHDIANGLTERSLTGDSEKLASTFMSVIQKKLPSTLDNDSDSDTRSILSSIVLEFIHDIKQWKKDKNASSSSTCYAHNKSSQIFEIRPKDADKKTVDLVGRPIQHLSAVKNCTGESTFLDDVPYSANELFGHLILTTEARAKILSIDPSAALEIDGVVDFIDYASSGLKHEQNNYGMHEKDEQIFKEGISDSVGQILGILLATDPILAKKASHLVKVQYDISAESRKTSPPVFTIEEAIEKKSFLHPTSVQSGDIEKSLAQSEKIIEGELKSGGQKHFYMETTGARAIPIEDGGVSVSVTGQAITNAQDLVVKTLGISANKVIVTCLRTGGGFGGKEGRPNHLAAIVALVATKHNRPVRCVIPRSQDSETVGGRHPFIFRYKVGFNSDGQINGIAADIFSNAGSTNDVSSFVMQICVQTLVASYNIPSWDIKGTPCLTNLQSNTAFRGFGVPQSTFFIENVIERVAESLKKDSDEIRQRHLFKEGEVISFSGQPLENCTIRRCWTEVVENAKVEERKKAIKEFNQNNKFTKRGLSMSTVSQSAGFPVPFMNQAAALVMIYADGSVQLNHGGIEMGQGLYTKMAQICSRVLGIPVEKIVNTATTTEKVPNTIVSAGSNTTDLNGPAVIAACEELNRRLEPIKATNPNGTWEQWIGAAFFNRVSLSATGFNKLEFPHHCNYYTYGVACTEVEINCLTGEQTVLRCDIVMDVGESLNPAIDIGQIEGGYIMGMGLFILEDTEFSENGQLVSNIPLNYKIPTVGSVPKEFNVSLLRGAPNPRAVYSSKAIGEPPLVLAVSSYLAIQNAVKAFLKENNQSTDISIQSPLTADRIRRICSGRF